VRVYAANLRSGFTAFGALRLIEPPPPPETKNRPPPPPRIPPVAPRPSVRPVSTAVPNDRISGSGFDRRPTPATTPAPAAATRP